VDEQIADVRVVFALFQGPCCTDLLHTLHLHHFPCSKMEGSQLDGFLFKQVGHIALVDFVHSLEAVSRGALAEPSQVPKVLLQDLQHHPICANKAFGHSNHIFFAHLGWNAVGRIGISCEILVLINVEEIATFLRHGFALAIHFAAIGGCLDCLQYISITPV